MRGINAANPLRVTGRAVYYPFGAETGFFYAGTFQGTRKRGHRRRVRPPGGRPIYSADGFLELPSVRKTQGLTVQVNWMRYDGGTFLAVFPDRTRGWFEAGYHLWNHRLTPFVQYQARNFADGATPTSRTCRREPPTG